MGIVSEHGYWELGHFLNRNPGSGPEIGTCVETGVATESLDNCGNQNMCGSWKLGHFLKPGSTLCIVLLMLLLHPAAADPLTVNKDDLLSAPLFSALLLSSLILVATIGIVYCTGAIATVQAPRERVSLGTAPRLAGSNPRAQAAIVAPPPVLIQQEAHLVKSKHPGTRSSGSARWRCSCGCGGSLL